MITSSASNNLGNTLFSKARQAILSLLYSHVDEAFYLRQIARTTGIGLGPVQRELKQLADAGIITREVQGRQVYYRANEECPIFNDLKSIVRKTFGVADVIRLSLEPLADKIQVAFIFGSIASGTEQRASDIDLLVVGDLDETALHVALMQAQEQLKRTINYILLSRNEFRRRHREKKGFLARVLAGPKIGIVGSTDEI